MARGPRPLLYRASRYVSIAATVVAVLLVLYVGAGIYSASMVRPGGSNGSQVRQNVTSAGFEVTATVNFSNPGFFPISNVHLAAVIENPGGGGVLARGGSPNLTVAADSVAQVPLTVVIPFAQGTTGSFLATHDAVLPTSIWANVSFAPLFAIHVQVPDNVSWGAPLANLTLTPQITPGPNGSAPSLTLWVFFNDHAPFPVNGAVHLTVDGQGGSACTVNLPPIDLTAAPSGSDNQSATVSIPSGCSFPAGTPVTGGFSSSGWNVVLPTEMLP